MKKKFASGMNIGTSSILVTFVLLCLVTFAALSFVSANSDYTLSKQAAERTTRYYEANKMAEIYLANIEAQLSKSRSYCSDEDSYMQNIRHLFADNDTITVSTKEGHTSISYAVAINENQNLMVTLYAHYPGKDGDFSVFHIHRWASSATDVSYEDADEGQNVKLMDF